MAYVVIEVVLVGPGSLAVAYGTWKLHVAMRRNRKEVRHSDWLREVRNWKPTGDEVVPTHQVKIVTFIAIALTYLIIAAIVLFLLLL